MRNLVRAVLVLAIPLMLFAVVWQSSRFSALKREALTIELRQEEVIDSNKLLISGISLLSTPERIEKVAVSELSMRRALKDEILRIALKKGGRGG